MLSDLDIATAVIRHCEGCRLSPYLDLHNYWTIGFGNRCTIGGKAVTEHTSALTLDQAEALLQSTLMSAVQPKLAAMVRVPLLPHQAGALMSLVYNIGSSAFSTSTLLRYLNRSEVDLAWPQFARWIYVEGRPVRGLVTRRALEQSVAMDRVDPATFVPFELPSPPHPLFSSNRTSLLDPCDMADALNAKELATLRPIPT